MRKQPKLMVICRGFAPMVAGSTILLNNLLTDYQGEAVAMAGPVNYAIADKNFKPACRVYNHNVIKNQFFIDHYDMIMHYFSFLIARYFDNKIKKERPSIIMAAFPEVQYFIEAYKAAKRNKIPFYAHMHDLWEENYPDGSVQLKLARQWEREILTNAKRVLCMNQVQKEHYQKKYNIECNIMPHTISKEVLQSTPAKMNTSDDDTLLFTGSISSHMNMDALKVISKASAIIDRKHTFLMCTPTKRENVEAIGITSPYLQVKYVTRTEVQKIQNHAAVLIAPLSHKNGSMDEVKTVFSTKLLEYLIAGRPILIFAPADSFHAISAKERGWGYVVSEDTPEAIKRGVEELMENAQLCEQLVINAFKEAESRLAEPFAKELLSFVIRDSQ